MKKSIKYVLIGIIGISAFTSFFILSSILLSNEGPPPLESVSDISLVVDYNNGTIKQVGNFTLDGGKTTAFDALDKWCEVRYDDFGWGIIVREIDSVSGNWIYMVNDQSPSIGSDSYPLEDGDIVEWEKID